MMPFSSRVFCWAAVIGLGVSSAVAAQNIWYVKQNVSGGANDGSDWDNAFVELQSALAAASTGDQIWVAAGTYLPDYDVTSQTHTGDRTATFQLINGVGLYGGFAGIEIHVDDRNTAINATILSGDIGQAGIDIDNSYHVVTASGIDSTTILSTFVIVGGRADGPSEPDAFGGGMYNENSSPTISFCRFFDNYAAQRGGAMLNQGGSPQILNCRFISNHSAQEAGGIFNRESYPTIGSCVFIKNSADAFGGAVVNFNSPTLLINCTITLNTALLFGGAVASKDSDPILANCILWANHFDPIFVFGTGMTTVSYSCVEGGYDGVGNIREQPLFVDLDGNDNVAGTSDDSVELAPVSPCIDAGNNMLVPEGIITDVCRYPRFNDDPDTTDSGVGTPPIVDMGASEYWIWYGGYRLYVDAKATGANDGTSWKDAYTDLQPALTVARARGASEIWVASGVFTPTNGTGDREASFRLLSGVAIYGGFAGGETALNQRNPRGNATILSGDLNGDDGPNFANTDDNSYHVVTAGGTNATAVLDGFTITAGKADSNGGGGGVYLWSASPRLVNCAFVRNWSSDYGGGIYCASFCSPTIINCLFTENWADHGGALSGDFYQSRPTIMNCTFSKNSAEYTGGGIWIFNGQPLIANCVLWGNIAPFGPELSLTDSSTVSVAYSNVKGGESGVYVGDGSLVWGPGNIDADPLFTPAGFHLAPGSPCIDAGDNLAVPSSVVTDAEGNLRFVDDPHVADTGNGTPPIVDMGAYESHPPRPGDFDFDNDVDQADLSMFEACSTGPSIPYNPASLPQGCTLTPDGEGVIPADFDRDGDVDQLDFGLFQRCFGAPGALVDPGCTN